MMLLEHDAKQLLAAAGIPVPAGLLVTEKGAAAGVPLPVVIKAQVPVGGRGKAGGIRFAALESEVATAVTEILGMSIKGHRVHALRVETPVTAAAEAYFSIGIDAASARVRIMASASGGVEIEEHADSLLIAWAELDEASIAAAGMSLADAMPEDLRPPIRDAAVALARAFVESEAVLLEINPLFVMADGSWIAGDAKMVVDDNAFDRQPDLRELVSTSALYPQEALKLAQGYDFVILDEGGDIGLVTTGAGLSMQLIDELAGRGLSPYNFCDIRTGMFRGDPSRLVEVLTRMSEAPTIRVVLINFFAGLTDLGEVARLLIVALAAVPQLRVPIVARLIGNNAAEAGRIIAESGLPIEVVANLDTAMDRATALMEQEQ